MNLVSSKWIVKGTITNKQKSNRGKSEIKAGTILQLCKYCSAQNSAMVTSGKK